MLGSFANGSDISLFMVTANIGQKQARNSETASINFSFMVSVIPCLIVHVWSSWWWVGV